jgi:hypothetical protein
MAELGRCVVYEWGWQFILIAIIVASFVVVGLLFLAKFFKLNLPTSVLSQTNLFEKIALKGPIANFAGWIVVLGAIGYAVYFGYDKFHTTYSVAFDTASAPSVDLEMLRSKFQRDTKATIILSHRAKAFSVSGHYEGACTPELFESICRQYPDRLSCNGSWVNQTMSVDAR